MSEIEYITTGEMAELCGVDVHTIRRALRADQQRPEHERRIPGAVRVGSRWRGEWRIPRRVAESWQRDPRGRR